jgi:uncharacterized protein (TIGR02444 family)
MKQMISVWAFSCNLYQQSVVKERCLFLQDEYGANVPVLLYCCWAGCYFPSLSSEQLANVQKVADLWSEQCIRPLRDIRRAMKTTDVTHSEQSSWQGIREQVKALELSAEKQLLSALERQSEAYVAEAQRMPDSTINNLVGSFAVSFPRLFSDEASIRAIADIVHAVHPEIQYDVGLKVLRQIDHSPKGIG